MVLPRKHTKGAKTSVLRLVRLIAALCAGVLGAVATLPSDAMAKVIGFEVLKIESPAFGGRSCGSIG
jgi:hypothetical protein